MVTDPVSGSTYDRRPGFEARLRARVARVSKRRAKGFVWLAIAALAYLTRERHADRRPLRPGDPTVRRILVTRVDLLGDVALTLPAVRALKRAYPAAAIDMLTLRSTAPILVGEGAVVARALTFDPYLWRKPLDLLKPRVWREALGLLGTLRAARYDLALSVSGDIGSILTRLSGARRRFGYRAEAYPFLLTDSLRGGRYSERKHETQYVLALAAAAGAPITPDDGQLKLHVTPAAAQAIAERLRALRQQMGVRGPLIALHAGARNGQAKRWPPERIASLIARVASELDALVILTGAPNEQPLAQAALALCPTAALAHVADLTGQTTIPELIALLAASDVVVSGDSGPMHIACAVGAAVVALHGPTDPALSGPTAPDAIILRRADLWCSPCYDASETAECRFHNPVCMKDLMPDAVFAGIRTQLIRRGWPLAQQTHALLRVP